MLIRILPKLASISALSLFLLGTVVLSLFILFFLFMLLAFHKCLIVLGFLLLKNSQLIIMVIGRASWYGFLLQLDRSLSLIGLFSIWEADCWLWASLSLKSIRSLSVKEFILGDFVPG